ncbi:MAG: dihydropyrimidinase [Candidatus Sumerlaeaceae bacterium]|nr:dihydropyrimidinase [Candidatus Sumerlaeaceae bacterium]
MSVLIRQGRIVTAADDYVADLFIENETITQIGEHLEIEADEIIEARGKLVFPGGVDPHVHLDLPVGAVVSSDDYESGTRAAACGGTTTVMDFPTQERGRSLFEALELWHEKARQKACVDYAFHMIVCDMPPERETELRKVVEEGIPSFKLFTAYPDRLYVDDGTLYRVMRNAGELGAVVMMHAENGIVIDEIVRQACAEGHRDPRWHALTRPAIMEAEAVHRCVAIAQVARAVLYVVHISCAAALEPLRAARDRGQLVFGETCPQYLLLDHTAYEKPGFEGAKWVMTPPLRSKHDQTELWKALRMGDIQTVGTDHCPFMMCDKERGLENFTKIPNGAPGIENRMALLFHAGVRSGALSLNRFVQVTSTNAAKIFGLFPKKGTIAVGSDADVVIFNPEREETISVSNPRTHHMRVDYNTYEGMRVQGIPETVLLRGRIIVRNGEFVGKPGYGRFLKRRSYEEPVI